MNTSTVASKSLDLPGLEILVLVEAVESSLHLRHQLRLLRYHASLFRVDSIRMGATCFACAIKATRECAMEL